MASSTGLNEESCIRRMMSVTNTQDSIQSLSLWIIHHKMHHMRIVELWYKALKNTVKVSHRLTLFYLCNDVVQTCKRKKASMFADAFKMVLGQATTLVRDQTIKGKVQRIFSIWDQRQVFDSDYLADLKDVLEGNESDTAIFKMPFAHRKAKEKSKKDKIKVKEVESCPSFDEFVDILPDDNTEGVASPSMGFVQDDVPSEETLATFKPSDMIENVSTFKYQESELDIKIRQASQLRLDASSAEAVKQLKDRAHGNEFSTQFEDSCRRMEDAVEALQKKQAGEKDVLQLLHISEHFYDQQYREARIVANAYKNYGARINAVSRKTVDLRRSLPSPPLSPAVEAMPLANNLPCLVNDYSLMDGTVTTHTSGPTDEDALPSPPDEAPSPPDLSPEDCAAEAVDATLTPNPAPSEANSNSSSLDNRIANLIPDIHNSEASHPLTIQQVALDCYPVYVPQSINGTGSAVQCVSPGTPPTTAPETTPIVDDTGGSTPLADERPTTPVMDEDSVDLHPSPVPTSPQEENPIDFLSRLISQTQKSKRADETNSSASFIECFSRLTNRVKEHVALNNGAAFENCSQAPQNWATWKKENASESSMECNEMPASIVTNASYTSITTGSTIEVSPVLTNSLHCPTATSPNWVDNAGVSFYRNAFTNLDLRGKGNDSHSKGNTMFSSNIVYPPVVEEIGSSTLSSLSVLPTKDSLHTYSNADHTELSFGVDQLLPSPSVSFPPPTLPPPTQPCGDVDSDERTYGKGNSIPTVESCSKNEAQEFMEKLKWKTSLANIWPCPSYSQNPVFPNLRTLTPGGEMDMDLEDGHEIEDGELKDSVTHIPVLGSIVRRAGITEQRSVKEKESIHQMVRDFSGKYTAPQYTKSLPLRSSVQQVDVPFGTGGQRGYGDSGGIYAQQPQCPRFTYRGGTSEGFALNRNAYYQHYLNSSPDVFRAGYTGNFPSSRLESGPGNIRGGMHRVRNSRSHPY